MHDGLHARTGLVPVTTTSERTSLAVESKRLVRLDLRSLPQCAEKRDEDVVIWSEYYRTKNFLAWLLVEVLLFPICVSSVPNGVMFLLWFGVSSLFAWPVFPAAFIVMLAVHFLTMCWLLDPGQLWHDFCHRHELLGTRKLSMDLLTCQMIMAEAFDKAPARNSVQRVNLSEFYVMLRNVPQDGEYDAYVTLVLCWTVTLPRWVCDALDCPVYLETYSQQEMQRALVRAEAFRAKLESVLALMPATAGDAYAKRENAMAEPDQEVAAPTTLDAEQFLQKMARRFHK